VLAASSETGNAEVLVARNGVITDRFVQVLKNLFFEFQLLDGCFDHQVALTQRHRAGRGRDAIDVGAGFLRGEGVALGAVLVNFAMVAMPFATCSALRSFK